MFSHLFFSLPTSVMRKIQLHFPYILPNIQINKGNSHTPDLHRLIRWLAASVGLVSSSWLVALRSSKFRMYRQMSPFSSRIGAINWLQKNRLPVKQKKQVNSHKNLTVTSYILLSLLNSLKYLFQAILFCSLVPHTSITSTYITAFCHISFHTNSHDHLSQSCLPYFLTNKPHKVRQYHFRQCAKSIILHTYTIKLFSFIFLHINFISNLADFTASTITTTIFSVHILYNLQYTSHFRSYTILFACQHHST